MPALKERSTISSTTRAELRRVVALIQKRRRQESAPTVCLTISGEAAEISVSSDTLDQIARLLEKAAEGRGITTRRREQGELTTQEAADLLGVSRTYLVKLLDAGKIPYRRVGHYRRIRKEDLANFESEDQERRRQGMAELAALTQDIGLKY